MLPEYQNFDLKGGYDEAVVLEKEQGIRIVTKISFLRKITIMVTVRFQLSGM